MRRTTMFVLAALSLSSCTSSGPNFRAMNAQQLADYNAGLPMWDQVACVEERRTGSHLKKTVCMTNREFQLRDLGVASGINSATVDNRTSVEAF